MQMIRHFLGPSPAVNMMKGEAKTTFYYFKKQEKK
jgi:hypothetical protein